jgi:hypothetical protein
MQSITEKHRPKFLSEIVGQDKAVAALEKFAARPHSQAFLFHGLSGTGKTASAIALARQLGCAVHQGEWGGLHQIPAGEQSAANVREKAKELAHIPFQGSGWKVLVVNESDQMSKQAEVTWLDILENLPARTVVVFTTNNVGNLSDRFIDRTMSIEFGGAWNEASVAGAQDLVNRIWSGECTGAAAPLLSDLGFVNEKRMSYRAVVQSLARHILECREIEVIESVEEMPWTDDSFMSSGDDLLSIV